MGGRKGLVPEMGEARFFLGAGWRKMPLAAKAPVARLAAGLGGLTGRGRGVGLQEEAPGPRSRARVAVRAGAGGPSALEYAKERVWLEGWQSKQQCARRAGQEGAARSEGRGSAGPRVRARRRPGLTLSRPRGAHGVGVRGGRAAATAAAAGGWRRHGGGGSEGAPGASSRSGSAGSGSRRGRGCCRGARRAQQSGGRRRRREQLPPVPARAAAAASSSGADKGGAEGGDGGCGRGGFTGAGRRAAVAALLSLLSCGDRERELCLRRCQNPP